MGKRKLFSDAELIEAIKQGGSVREQAMRQLYLSERDTALGYLAKLGAEEEKARDLFQDAVVSVMIAVEEEKFQGQSSLRTYLFAVCKNQWFAHLRRRNVEQRYRDGLSPAEERIVAETPEVRTIEHHQQAMISHLLEGVGKACKQVLSLWSLKYSMEEIAERMGYANGQIARNKKSKCLRKLKELVKEHPAIRSLVQEMIES